MNMVVDLASCLPWFFVTGMRLGDFPATTSLRAIRIVRLLKSERYLNAWESVGRVLSREWNALSAGRGAQPRPGGKGTISKILTRERRAVLGDRA